MRNEEYNQIVQDYLSDTWGARCYPAAQITRLWTIVRDLSSSEFRYAVEQLNLSAVRAPTLGQIRTSLLPAIDRIAKDKRKEKLTELGKKGPCRYCAHTGYVNAYRPETPLQEFSFLCPNCPAASLLGFKENRGMRLWTPQMVELGWVVRFYDLASEKEFAKAQAAVMPKPKKRGVVDLATDEAIDTGVRDVLSEVPF